MEATSEPDLDDKRLAGWSGDGPTDGGHTLGLGIDTAAASRECFELSQVRCSGFSDFVEYS